MKSPNDPFDSNRKRRLTGAILCLVLFVALAIAIQEWMTPPAPGSFVGTVLMILLLSLGLVTVWLFSGTIAFFSSFLGSLALAAMFVLPTFLSELLALVPIIGPLWSGQGLPATILELVLLIVCWCLIFLLIRLGQTRTEEKAVAELRDKIELADTGEDRDKVLETNEFRPGSLTARRVKVLKDNCGIPERAHNLLADQAEVDSAALAVSYGPLRAIVWALPALGFIGTAATMASSIRGVGAVIDGQSGGPATFQMFTEVVPHLADAFSITLVALAATILCYFFLALVYQREERVLVGISEVFIDLLPRAIDLLPPPIADRFPGEQLLTQVSDRLFAEMWSLEKEVAKLNGELTQLMHGRSVAHTWNTYLYLITNYLEILSELAFEQAEQGHTAQAATHDRRQASGAASVLREMFAYAKSVVDNRTAGNASTSDPDAEIRSKDS